MRIKERQNEVDILKRQYVARHCYNSAEVTGNISRLCSLVIVIISFYFAEKDPILCTYIIAATTILECVLDKICCFYIKTGAALRTYIDNYLFEFKPRDYYGDFSEKWLVCFSNLICKLHRKTYIKQTTNTETDKYHGVKNWYSLKAENGSVDDIISCQKENVYYDKCISGTYIAVIIFLIISFIVLLVKVDDKGLLICASLSLIIKVAEYIVDIFRYISCHREIDKLIAKTEISQKIELVAKLQDAINHRRQLNIVPLSLFHKTFSKFKAKYL